MQLDELFGSLRDRVIDPAVDDLKARAKEFFGGVQGEITGGGGEPTRYRVSFGERRVISAAALAIALGVGVLIAVVVFGKRGR